MVHIVNECNIENININDTIKANVTDNNELISVENNTTIMKANSCKTCHHYQSEYACNGQEVVCHEWIESLYKEKGKSNEN